LGFFLRNCFGLDLFLAFLPGLCFLGFIESGLFGDDKIIPTLFDLLLYNLLVSFKSLAGILFFRLAFLLVWLLSGSGSFFLLLSGESGNIDSDLAGAEIGAIVLLPDQLPSVFVLKSHKGQSATVALIVLGDAAVGDLVHPAEVLHDLFFGEDLGHVFDDDSADCGTVR
jgi:hypothetical protein